MDAVIISGVIIGSIIVVGIIGSRWEDIVEGQRREIRIRQNP